LFSFLCTPNNNLPRITKMVRELAGSGKFASAADIALRGEAALRKAGFGYRAATIVRVAHIVAERGANWLEGLAELPYETAREKLAELPGVGLKIADCVCLFGLGKMEAAPLDVHLWRAICDLYLPEWSMSALTEAKYRLAGAKFRGIFGSYAGWAQQFLYFDRLLGGRRKIVASGSPELAYN
jgi:N-glycosylase/DNA lyase